jgi:hypothetical protein
MTLTTTSEAVFSCYRRSCAPPPVGKGGSNKGGARGGDKARRAGIAAAKAQSSYYNLKKRFGGDQDKATAAEHSATVIAGKKARFKQDQRTGNTRQAKKAARENDPMVKADTAYDKYRALQAENRKKKG